LPLLASFYDYYTISLYQKSRSDARALPKKESKMDKKSKLFTLEEKDGHHSFPDPKDIGEAVGPPLYITKFVLGAVTFLWLVTETGDFFQCRLHLQENQLFWPLWITLWSVLLLGGFVADLLLRK
jgi:hypothetical protein